MGKIGEEITQQIKSAVKAKLIELGIEVDNELPDYIMVLVANKKTQPQMEKDLHLFLGTNTTLFTTWLLNVLKKLEEVTVSKRNYKKIEVTNQAGSSGVIITKKEEDMDKKKSLMLDRVKIEPGVEANDSCLDIRNSEELSVEEEGNNENDKSNTQESASTDNDEDETQAPSKSDEKEASHQDSTEQLQLNNSNDAIDEDTSHIQTPSQEQEDKLDDYESSDNVALDQEADTSDGYRSDNNEQDENIRSDSNRPKIVYSEISEQIDEVMKKTINGNRRPREEIDRYSDDRDNRSFVDKKSFYDDNARSHGGQRRSFDDDYHQDRKRLSDDRLRRSPEEYDRIREARRRSPESRRRIYERRSPDDRRRSPLDKRRVSEYRKRSPDDRRRFPLDRRRSPSDDRRRSPLRRRSLDNRRRSPDDKRRSPDRRLYDDYKRDSRRSPDDRGRLRIVDAREILKRKSRNEDISSLEHTNGSEKRRKVISSLVHKPDSLRDKSPEPQIPSLVRVTPRPVRKDAIQPNKKLLLLAVADAEKSVSRHSSTHPTSSHPSSARKRERSLPRHNRKSRGSKTDRSRNSPSPTENYVPPEKIFVTLKNQKYSTDNKERYSHPSREVSARKVYDESDFIMEDELLYEEPYLDSDQEEDADMGDVYSREKVAEYVPRKVNEIIQTKSNVSDKAKCIISLESSPERSCDEWEDGAESTEKSQKAVGEIVVESDTPTQEPQENSSTIMERFEEGFEWNRLGPAPIATVKPLSQRSQNNEKYKCEAMNKALERCKYWPSCLSENCIYYHPSSVCKMFPMCKSEKECLFIHPDCKFGPSCLNKKCNFLHRSLEDKKKEVPAPLSLGKPTGNLVKCSFFPNCKNLNCKFWHPVKNCKFGRTCARSDCYFFHPTLVIPPKELLTWSSATN